MIGIEKIKIEPLACHKHLIPVVAEWYLSVFGRKETTIGKFETIFKNRLNIDHLDCCFLAFIDGVAVGTISVTANGIPNKPTLSTCIMHLFVLEEYRH